MAPPSTGLSIHLWIRLDPVRPQPGQAQCRRQLYSFYTNSGHGLEAFFNSDGDLVVSTAYKKDFFSTQIVDTSLNDEQWHSLSICQAPGKRPFGGSQLVVYVDGAERKTSALKYPTLTEPFVYCRFGAELDRANATSISSDPSSKLSIRDNIKDAIKSSVPGVFALPQYLKSGNSDPDIQWTMIGRDFIMIFI